MGYNGALVVAPLAAGVVLGLMNSYPALFALAAVVTAARWMDGHPASARCCDRLYQIDMKRHTWQGEHTIVEVTPLTKWAFRSARGLIGGLVFLLISVVALGLSACGAPSYTYVADSSAQTYYKVPYGWHQISQQSLNAR
jgi:hypothetical protein